MFLVYLIDKCGSYYCATVFQTITEAKEYGAAQIDDVWTHYEIKEV
jgi:hypothetical protein